MVPQIKFVYSSAYDSICLDQARLLKIESNYPIKEQILDRIKEAEQYWKENGEKIVKSISIQSNLEWISEEILVYVVGKSVPFSSPLTMPMYLNRGQDKTFRSWINVLTHELIHNILADNNWSNFKNLASLLNYKGDLEVSTYNHIPVHAVHSLVYKDIFTDEDLLGDIERSKQLPGYFKAWEIVLEKGDSNIVGLFR